MLALEIIKNDSFQNDNAEKKYAHVGLYLLTVS